MYVSFVAGAWKALLDSNWFNEIKTVKIWSDGGPKHFKISANMKLLLKIQHVTLVVSVLVKYIIQYIQILYPLDIEFQYDGYRINRISSTSQPQQTEKAYNS